LDSVTISAYLESDEVFDTLYPAAIQLASRRFWTPVATARRAAELLRDAGARRVLDVGSGVGKLVLVAAATVPEITWEGIELRPRLVAVARAAQAVLGIENASFTEGDATGRSWAGYDGFYFYNPFAENLFASEEQLDPREDLNLAAFSRHVRETDLILRAAPVGTAVVTFHGLSGRVPCTYDNAHREMSVSGWLRLWVKTAAKDDGSFFVETGPNLERHGPRRPVRADGSR
jgi:SAM-dependent methyltransferase